MVYLFDLCRFRHFVYGKHTLFSCAIKFLEFHEDAKFAKNKSNAYVKQVFKLQRVLTRPLLQDRYYDFEIHSPKILGYSK